MGERAAVLQIGCDAGRAPSVIADARLEADRGRAPLDHAIGVLLPHGVAGELAGLAGRRLE